MVDELLQPIAGDNPSGRDLRYAPVSDQIREARRVEEEMEQGVWKRELKRADYKIVVKVATDALAKQGKDLQVAAWLTEAWTSQLGYPGLRQGLELIRRMIETFWDTVYPAIDDDGDLEMRATPLMWIGTQMDRVIRAVPLTTNGLTWFDYHFAKGVPTEQEAGHDDAKQALRRDAIDRKRPTPEVFEEGCTATPAAHFERLRDELAAAQDELNALSALAEEKFGDASPGFPHLRDLLDEISQTVRVLLVRRKAPESAAAPAATTAAAPQQSAPSSSSSSGAIVEAFPMDDWGDTPAAPVESAEEPSVEPEDEWSSASSSASDYSGDEDRFNPAPFLAACAARWGEVYGGGEYLETSLLEGPPQSLRVELRRLWQESEYDVLLSSAAKAMAMPCGRGWLDLYRYAIRAAESVGRDAIARALRSFLRALLADYPKLPETSLTDDTPAANHETRDWLRSEGLLGGVVAASASFRWQEPAVAAPDNGEPASPDVFDLAMEAARGGRIAEAMGLMSREAAGESSGRGRFLRKMQLVEICLATGNTAIALPILQQLDEEIERRQLEEWESPDLVAQPLAMLYRSLDSDQDPDIKARLYSRICRLDPSRALSLSR